ncbi:unnamed protein product [Cuscuta campestris]|uniref:RING-type domain-containing protein n=1 Tax=Cuscuta campestris TaxID=132261 RepID=A0A484NP80_9ASTE|nr:unnamed protein product [Cuscuta campestris]
METFARAVKYVRLFKPDPTHGCIAVTTTDKLSTASAGFPESSVTAAVHRFPAVYFNPLLEFRSRESASAFFAAVVGGLMGWDRGSAAHITAGMAAHAFETVASGRWTYGVHVNVELETLGVFEEHLPGFLESGLVDERGREILRKGMPEAEISMLRKELGGGKGGGTCAICLEDFCGGAVTTPVSPCSHRFHNSCISTWLRKNRACPMCRARCTVGV